MAGNYELLDVTWTAIDASFIEDEQKPKLHFQINVWENKN